MQVERAPHKNRPGDILVLADEAPTPDLRVQANRAAGKALMSLEQFDLALSRFEEALALAPEDLKSRRQKGLALARLGRHRAAKAWAAALVQQFPSDAKSWVLLGRVNKAGWVERWRHGTSAAARRARALREEGLLRDAAKAYATGFRKDPTDYDAGINAVVLARVLDHLKRKRHRSAALRELEGEVREAARAALAKDGKDNRAQAALAELEVLLHARTKAAAADRNAVAAASGGWRELNAARERLLLLSDLGLRTAAIAAALRTVEGALARLAPKAPAAVPRQVFLFSGHMIDAPGRPEPRFPPDKEKIAAAAIAAKLSQLRIGAGDLAICGGACGGDILFAEAALVRGARLELRLPFEKPTFLEKSVAFAGAGWVTRFHRINGDAKTRLFVMPEELGPLPEGANAYARNNLWQLYSALAWGPKKVRFVCLWNGQGGDGPGGTQHMVETVQQYAGRVYVLDTNELW